VIAFHEPPTIAEACALAERYGDEARFVTGGTALAILLRQGLVTPAALISVGRIPALCAVEPLAGGGLRIGAALKLRALERDARLVAAWPMVAAAIRAVATPRIRNMATLGGGLAHADPAQDPPVALAAAEATIVVAGPAERRIPAATFATGYYETALAPNELIVAVELPPRSTTCAGAYLKFLRARSRTTVS
jgi:carbon-monoxide dehydrogenase medium subunit